MPGWEEKAALFERQVGSIALEGKTNHAFRAFFSFALFCTDDDLPLVWGGGFHEPFRGPARPHRTVGVRPGHGHQSTPDVSGCDGKHSRETGVKGEHGHTFEDTSRMAPSLSTWGRN